MVFTPSVAERELDAGVHGGVLVAKAGAGYVGSIGTEVDGALGVDEVVDAYSALGGEVPHAGVRVGPVVDEVERLRSERGILVVGPEETTGGLGPGGEATGSGEVPAQNDGRDAGSCKGAANGVEG